ncbi:MAG: PTS sugar transporter subunit IIA [Pseudomonadota bacterium]
MNLQSLVSVDRLRLAVPVRSKKHAIEVAAGCLAEGLDDVSANRLFDALFARERLGCTTLGRGVALPHAALEDIDASRGCIITFAEPIVFDDDDPNPVSLILALVVPSQSQGVDNDDLKLACDFLSRGDHRRALMAASTPEQLFEALAGDSTPPLQEATAG